MSAQDGSRIAGATVLFLDSPNAGRSTTTNASGEYRFENLTEVGANLSANASRYAEARAGVLVNGTNRLNFTLRTSEPWAEGGTGNHVFNIPSYFNRVRITGSCDCSSTNFIVWIGDRLVVNELLGGFWGTDRYEGVHVNPGGRVEIRNSTQVRWVLREER